MSDLSGNTLSDDCKSLTVHAPETTQRLRRSYASFLDQARSVHNSNVSLSYVLSNYLLEHHPDMHLDITLQIHRRINREMTRLLRLIRPFLHSPRHWIVALNSKLRVLTFQYKDDFTFLKQKDGDDYLFVYNYSVDDPFYHKSVTIPIGNLIAYIRTESPYYVYIALK
jgi:hypothetical protein